MTTLTTPAVAAPALGEAPGPEDTPAVNGQWGPVENWPLVAIHSALDANGNVVTYGTNGNGGQTGRFIYDIWTPGPSAATGHSTLPNTTQTDLFCSLQINIAETGEMLMFGGDLFDGTRALNQPNPDINSLDSATGQLTNLPGMHRPRWYGTGTTLPDGSVLVQGGEGGRDRAEVWSPQTGSRLLDFDTSGVHWFYPRNFVIPDGRIFGIDVVGRLYYISAELDDLTIVGRLGEDRWGYGATAVMFEPGKILHFGGPSNSAVVIDVTGGGNPVVTPAPAMSSARDWVDGTLLPDGRVLATGGASNWVAAQLAGLPLSGYDATNTAEIWDPRTNQWTVETAGVNGRFYHSTSLLLPDGRVLVAGGGSPGPVTHIDAEIFSPDYLYAANGGTTVRPAITSISGADLVPGQNLAIGVDSDVDIGRVTLVKSGSVTHSFNMDQRFSELPFTVTGNTVNTTLPANGAEITPGTYLLTILTTTGVPSVSEVVTIGEEPPPPGLEDQISRLYQAYLLRAPDANGLEYWLDTAQSGVSLVDISDVFANSPEFVNRYGALNDAQFVDQVYANVLRRSPDAGGRAYWIGQLSAGITRGQMMLSFSESAEFISRGPIVGPPTPLAAPVAEPVAEDYRGEIHRLYQAYFRRNPDQAGLTYWTNQRAARIPLIVVSDVFAASGEFANAYGATTDEQFVDLLYANVLERPADAAGRAYWIGQLGAGISRGEVMLSFSESDEFVAKIGPVG